METFLLFSCGRKILLAYTPLHLRVNAGDMGSLGVGTAYGILAWDFGRERHTQTERDFI